jgi:hypothetical protein
MQAQKSADYYRFVEGILENVAGVIARDAVDVVWALNGLDPALKPSPKFSRLSFHDVLELIAALKDLSTAGLTLDPIKVYSWNKSTETLTFVQEADSQFAANGARTDLTKDRRWLVVPRSNSAVPWVFDMNTLPDIQRITDPPAASGNINQVSWTD